MATPEPSYFSILREPEVIRRLTVGAVLGCAIAWAYWAIFAQLADRWSVDPAYSHGYLVPVYAVAILWFRRKSLEGATPEASRLALVFLALGALLYVVGTVFYFTWFAQISLLPVVAAVFLALGGRNYLTWAWPAIVFLIFMIPLPARLDEPLARPLQRIATVASTNALQTLGIFAEAEGNVILLRHSQLGIVEACSGLRMLLMFFAASAAVAIVISRPWYHKTLIVVSAVPIAILCNVLRITLTGVLKETVSGPAADAFFHDLAGWLMIPLALLLLAAELWVLSRVFVPTAEPSGGAQASRFSTPTGIPANRAAAADSRPVADPVAR